MEEGKFIELAKKAKYASKKIATLPVGLKNTALLNIAKNLEENQSARENLTGVRVIRAFSRQRRTKTVSFQSSKA